MNIHSETPLQFVSLTYKIHQGATAITVLDCVDAIWHPHRTAALLGPSGSGKSTVLNLLAGFQQPTSGLIKYGETILTGSSENLWVSMRNHIFGYVFQAPLLIPEFSVIENVMLRALIAGKNFAELEDAAYALLQDVGLSHVATRCPISLSGGEQQRVAVARALFGNPKFLLFDEPTAHLDAVSAQQLLRLLEKIRHERAVGMIIATHDIAIASMMQEQWDLSEKKLILRVAS